MGRTKNNFKNMFLLFLFLIFNLINCSFAVPCQILIHDTTPNVTMPCGGDISTACKTIMDGIDAASQLTDADLKGCNDFTFNIGSGTYTGPQNTEIQFSIELANNSLPIIIHGNGNDTIIDGETKNSGWSVIVGTNQQIWFGNLQFQNTYRLKDTGGALSLWSQPGGHAIVDNVRFLRNIAPEGGAVAMQQNGTLEIINSLFDSNVAFQNAHNPEVCHQGGGAVLAGHYNQASMTLNIVGSTFVNNEALLSCGGAVLAVAKPMKGTIETSTFNNNRATNGGAMAVVGCVDCYNGVLNFTENAATAHGGAMYLSEDTHIIADIQANLNKADEAGGAIYIVKSALTIKESIFTANEALTFGGAIAVEQHALVKTTTGNVFANITAAANSAPQGTALYCAAPSEINPPLLDEQELCLSSCIDPQTSKCACNKCTSPAPTHGPAAPTPSPTPESSSPWPVIIIIVIIVLVLIGGAAGVYWWRKRSAGGRATFLNI